MNFKTRRRHKQRDDRQSDKESTQFFFILFETHASQSDNANEFHSRYVTKKMKQKMTKENEEISISQIDFESESSLFKNTC